MDIHKSNRCFLPYLDSEVIDMRYHTVVKKPDHRYAICLLSTDRYDTSDSFDTSVSNSINNLQLIDSGSRVIDEFHKKRFRELDFTFSNAKYNNDNDQIEFEGAFCIDEQLRQLGSFAEPYIEDNPNSSNYGTVTYDAGDHITYDDDRIIQDQMDLRYKVIVPETDFKDLNKLKLRFRISGKGYYAQYILKFKNDNADYELLNHA